MDTNTRVENLEQFVDKLMNAYEKSILLNAKLDSEALSNQTAALTMSWDIAECLKGVVSYIVDAGIQNIC